MVLVAGSRLGPYEVVSPIGAGDCRVVRDRGNGRQCVLPAATTDVVREDFGKIVTKHGHRVIETAVRLEF